MTATTFLTAFAEAIANDGALVLLILVILWMGARGVWVWKSLVERLEAQLTDERIEFMGRFNELREERDSWRRIALYTSGHPNPEGQPSKPPEHEGDD